jgi:transposase
MSAPVVLSVQPDPNETDVVLGHPKQHLSEFSGILQADGYAGFHHLYEGNRIQEAACWAHVRRKFYDIHVANGSAIAAEAIERIGLLYDIEREIRGKPVDERVEIRQARARPLMDDLHRWFHKTLAGLSRKSDTAVAIRYALSRWPALTRYLAEGSIEMDNSAAERALRTVAKKTKVSPGTLGEIPTPSPCEWHTLPELRRRYQKGVLAPQPC